MEKKMIECYSLEINDDDNSEVNWMSMVKTPAITIDWLAFSNANTRPTEEQQFKFQVQDAAKRMLTGVFMKAGKPIYRVDEKTGQEYAVMFTADNIERAVKKFQAKGYGRNVDTEHNVENNGSFIMDSWYIRDPKQNPLACYGFNDIEVGDWVGTVHVPNEEYWNEFIKTGKLKGFSVMGMFKFGEKKMIDFDFSAEPKVEKLKAEDFSKEELDMINKIADFLLDDDSL